MPPHVTFNPDVCNQRHTSVWRTVTALFLTLGILMTAIGWLITEVRTATVNAAGAATAVQVQVARADESRVNINEALTSLRVWIKTMSEKQDRMNDSLIRLVEAQERQNRESAKGQEK